MTAASNSAIWMTATSNSVIWMTPAIKSVITHAYPNKNRSYTSVVNRRSTRTREGEAAKCLQRHP
jgi:hypothetical protein